VENPSLAEHLRDLTVDPATTVLLFDFDGTLSPIVDDPASARPSDGVTELLAGLATRFGTVGVVSGRPLDVLVPMLPAGVVLSGQYGLERRAADGTVSGSADAWRDAIESAADDLRGRGVDPAALEPKGLSLTVHFRTRPGDEAAIRAAVDAVAGARSLAVHDAKRSVELRPPLAVDKGTVVRDLAAGAAAVLYVGDDVGDLPAFRALADLGASGVSTLAVAVDSTELPEAVREIADVTVDGPGAVVDLLRTLTAAV
jgi:trehalose 6-phosphate phosphatase